MLGFVLLMTTTTMMVTLTYFARKSFSLDSFLTKWSKPKHRICCFFLKGQWTVRSCTEEIWLFLTESRNSSKTTEHDPSNASVSQVGTLLSRWNNNTGYVLPRLSLKDRNSAFHRAAHISFPGPNKVEAAPLCKIRMSHLCAYACVDEWQNEFFFIELPRGRE